MALPKMDIPTYELELPTTGKKIKYRPFLVKEHKILLMLQNAIGDDIDNIVGDLITACTFEKLNGHEIPSVDAEFLYLNIRAKSIGEMFDFIINCECGNKIETQTNIEDIKVIKNPEHKTKINITDNVGIEMSYPSLSSALKVYNSDDSAEVFQMIAKSIKAVYTPADYTEIDQKDAVAVKELEAWLDTLTKEQFDKIESFFTTMPNISQKVEKTCDKCGAINNVEIKGLENFFI